MLLRRDERQPQHAGTSSSSAADDAESRRRWLCCRQCATRLLREEHAIGVQGPHLQVHANPAGLVFEIVLFSEAQNVCSSAWKSREFSWFAGYAWQLVDCRGCGLHLGWRFSAQTASPASFFGIVRERLVSEE